TGCSSIWGAYMPAMPYTTNKHGHGPAWANSLFEDNAEFGFGIHMGVNVRRSHLENHVKEILGIPEETDIDNGIITAPQVPEDEKPGKPLDSCPEDLEVLLRGWLKVKNDPSASYDMGNTICKCIVDNGLEDTSPYSELIENGDLFEKKSIWAVGGDGWAYDIGFGGVDEVLASGEDINLLVLDTEGYSNTGGEMSKSTQLGSVSGFAVNGKMTPRKKLAKMMTEYGYVYCAQICFGANMQQAIDALREADAYPGPSIVVALCPCISWGIKDGMSHVVPVMKDAVKTGFWDLWRFNPELAKEGKDPLILDSKGPDVSKLPEFLDGQDRFAPLLDKKPKLSGMLQSELAKDLEETYDLLEKDVIAYEPEK
ncbi:MAG: thiamine pyrophosphate-dependent enzyme, partial [Eggerthellaceae bacterium]|nr:thiamine pyrophosphate-dependent enzyme [Eggerthellaceae bacterium]